MNYTENGLNILTVRTFPQKGPAWIHKNLRGNETVETLCRLLDIETSDFIDQRDNIELSLNSLADCFDGLVALGDDDFPQPRGSVKPADMPYALFYKGDISLLQRANLNIAIIGVLNPDEKIEITERIVTKAILQTGATVVSGLALGCDTIAHKTTIENQGKTIAILPCPLNNIVPKENAELAKRIVETGGLLISEYYENPKSKNDMISRFVVRDRLQALYSDAVLLVASYAPNNLGNDCGSRHAMEKAKIYGIKRGVIYNETKHRDNNMYDLNRMIISEDKSVIRVDSNNLSDSIHTLTNRASKELLLF